MEVPIWYDIGHYGVLELEPGAESEEIRKAHRRLALKWHPDKVSDPGDEIAVKVATQQFQLIQAAYEILSDPEKRKRYDLQCQRDGAAGNFSEKEEAPWKKARRASSSRPAPAPGSSPRRTGWAHTEAASLNVPKDAPTIAAAVDLLSVSGGIISVEPGTYAGLIVVSKPFVTIRCSGPKSREVIVVGQVVFRQCAMGAKLEGLKIRASCSGGAVDLKGVIGNVTIQDCEISNDTSAGIIFEGCSGDTSITCSEVHDCKFDGLGLHLLKGKTTHKGSLNITNCKFENNGYDGLYLGDPRFKAHLLRSRVVGNRRHGVFVRGSEFTMEETIVEGNAQDAVHTETFSDKQSKSRSKFTKGEARAREVEAKELPDGWRAFKTAEGLTYYFHCATGSTRWSMPEASAEIPESPLQRLDDMAWGSRDQCDTAPESAALLHLGTCWKAEEQGSSNAASWDGETASSWSSFCTVASWGAGTWSAESATMWRPDHAPSWDPEDGAAAWANHGWDEVHWGSEPASSN